MPYNKGAGQTVVIALGGNALITSLENAAAGLEGETGTLILA